MLNARQYEIGQQKHFVPKWGMVCGHTKANQGLTYTVGDSVYTEYIYGTIMIPHCYVPWNTREEKGSVKSQLARSVDSLVKHQGVNATIEIHQNAFNGKARGFEIWYLDGDELSRSYAEEFVFQFGEQFFTRRNRGAKKARRSDRAYHNLIGAKLGGAKVALLAEMFFGDNENDYMSPNTQASFWRSVLGEE